MMFLNSFQVQGNFGVSTSTDDTIATQITAVGDLSSTCSAGESPPVLYQRDTAGRHRCHKTVKGGGDWEAVWSLNSETALTASDPPLNSIDSAHADTWHMESGGSREARDLIGRILCDPLQTTRVMELKDEDAQCMVDFLDNALRESGGLRTNEGNSFLYLLRGLSKSAQVFPQCYKLKNLQCDFSQPQEGGTFADIYEGEYKGWKICLKAVRVFGKEANSPMLRAYMKELVLWAHLSHPNILPFYGVYWHDGGPQRKCIVAPWMCHGNLSDYLETFPHSPRMALVSDIAAGLAYLHEMGVVHGDLKAKNVLISDDGRALIADFGISRIVSSVQPASTRLSNGTMRWTAPELLSGHSCNSPPTFESDIWSFGCLCYETFTCKIPFYQYSFDAQVFAALNNHREIPLRPEGDQLGSADDRKWGLMERCWDYNPHNRPRCDEIQQLIAEIGCLDTLRQAPLLLDLEIPPSWTPIGIKSKATVDHDRINRILLGILQAPLSVPASRPGIKLKSTRWSLAGVDPETPPTSLNFFRRVLGKIRAKSASIWKWVMKSLMEGA